MDDPTIQLLRDLVAIDSVNPSLAAPAGAAGGATAGAGAAAAGARAGAGAGGEGAIARFVADEMRALGLDVELQEALPGRPNAVGVLEGRRAGRSLMLCGHLDTVGVEGMEGPFTPRERDGWLYGRGAQDMKGGVAAMVGAARRLAESGGLGAGRLIVAAVVDEEFESAGAEALVRSWRADAAVVTEPTDLVIGLAHKGYCWLEAVTGGRAAHGSRPAEGRDAILRMGRVLARLEALDRSLQARPAHPLLGTASLHASLISGGRELSTYPDRCTLRLERRTLLDEPSGAPLAELEAVLDDLRAADPELEVSARQLFWRPAYETPAGHPLPDLLAEALAARGRPDRRAGISFWTDAAVLGHAGIPTVLFGPGGEGLHGTHERVRVDEVLACRDVLADLAQAFCG
ncbi:MAG: M20/M25/M40 family metallo-hydrolase [Acidobacteria bacterium]|nr:M20/M25/M40 family metallo-hydrolase [Acidobacteriota bacterium]